MQHPREGPAAQRAHHMECVHNDTKLSPSILRITGDFSLFMTNLSLIPRVKRIHPTRSRRSNLLCSACHHLPASHTFLRKEPHLMLSVSGWALQHLRPAYPHPRHHRHISMPSVSGWGLQQVSVRRHDAVGLDVSMPSVSGWTSATWLPGSDRAVPTAFLCRRYRAGL